MQLTTVAARTYNALLGRRPAEASGRTLDPNATMFKILLEAKTNEPSASRLLRNTDWACTPTGD